MLRLLIAIFQLLHSIYGSLQRVLRILHRVDRQTRSPRETVTGFQFTVEILDKKGPVIVMPLVINLNNEQLVRVKVAPVSKRGTPQPLDGDPDFTPDNVNAAVNYDPATKTATISPPDNFSGDVTVLVGADAKIGDGVDRIEDTILLHVSNPEATNLGLSFEIDEKPATVAGNGGTDTTTGAGGNG